MAGACEAGRLAAALRRGGVVRHATAVSHQHEILHVEVGLPGTAVRAGCRGAGFASR
jgi:hypothetical protein